MHVDTGFLFQRSLEEQKDRVSAIQLQLQQLTQAFSQDSGRTELAQLRCSLDNLKQQVSVIEGLKERLGKSLEQPQ